MGKQSAVQSVCDAPEQWMFQLRIPSSRRFSDQQRCRMSSQKPSDASVRPICQRSSLALTGSDQVRCPTPIPAACVRVSLTNKVHGIQLFRLGYATADGLPTWKGKLAYSLTRVMRALMKREWTATLCAALLSGLLYATSVDVARTLSCSRVYAVSRVENTSCCVRQRA
jgi:hypothetical protein